MRAQETINAAVDALTVEAFHSILLDFLDFSRLQERLANKTNTSIEFQDRKKGWCRGNIIAAERSPDGSLIRVLWVSVPRTALSVFRIFTRWPIKGHTKARRQTAAR